MSSIWKAAEPKLVFQAAGRSEAREEEKDLGAGSWEQGTNSKLKIQNSKFSARHPAPGTEISRSELREENLKDRLGGLWKDRMSRGGVFRYTLEGLQEKRIGRFIVQHNPGRIDREKEDGRPMEDKTDVVLPFGTPINESDLDFNKLNRGTEAQKLQRLMELEIKGVPAAVNINYAPLRENHFLLIPAPQENKPQVLDEDILRTALDFAEEMNEPDLFLGFNSPGAWASINHLHFQGAVISPDDLPIDGAKRDTISKPEDEIVIERLKDYPLQGLVFSGGGREALIQETFAFIRLLQTQNIPHIVLLREDSIYVIPRSRKRTELNPGGVGLFETAGRMYVSESQYNLKESVLTDKIKRALETASVSKEQFESLVREFLSGRRSEMRKGIVRSSSDARMVASSSVEKLEVGRFLGTALPSNIQHPTSNIPLQLGSALESIETMTGGEKLRRLKESFVSFENRERMKRMDQALDAAVHAAGLAAVQTAAVNEPRVFVTDVTEWSNIITLLQTAPAHIQIGVIAADENDLMSLRALKASLHHDYQKRLHIGIGRASLIGALREHFDITGEEAAQLVVPKPVLDDRGLHEAILLRAWTLLRSKLRLVEFSKEGLTAPGRKVYLTLDGLLEAFTLEAEARLARERAA